MSRYVALDSALFEAQFLRIERSVSEAVWQEWSVHTERLDLDAARAETCAPRLPNGRRQIDVPDAAGVIFDACRALCGREQLAHAHDTFFADIVEMGGRSCDLDALRSALGSRWDSACAAWNSLMRTMGFGSAPFAVEIHPPPWWLDPRVPVRALAGSATVGLTNPLALAPLLQFLDDTGVVRAVSENARVPKDPLGQELNRVLRWLGEASRARRWVLGWEWGT